MAVVEKTIDLIGDDAFCDLIISRKIPEGMPTDIYDEAVKRLRPYALRTMSGMQTLHLPNVTLCEVYSVAGCASLKSIIMENCTTLGERAFQDCHQLESIELPKVASIGMCCFAGGQAGDQPLKTVSLPSLATISDLAFYGRSGITSLIVPKVSYVASGGFTGLSGLTQLDLPSIRNIYGTPFNGCSGLQVINFGPNIVSMPSNLFSGTPAGVVINLPFEEGKFAGAPWGNADAIFNYGVEYCGDVPMPES